MDRFLLPNHLLSNVEMGTLAIVLKGEHWFLQTLKSPNLHGSLCGQLIGYLIFLLQLETFYSEEKTTSQAAEHFKLLPSLQMYSVGGNINPEMLNKELMIIALCHSTNNQVM